MKPQVARGCVSTRTVAPVKSRVEGGVELRLAVLRETVERDQRADLVVDREGGATGEHRSTLGLPDSEFPAKDPGDAQLLQNLSGPSGIAFAVVVGGTVRYRDYHVATSRNQGSISRNCS